MHDKNRERGKRKTIKKHKERRGGRGGGNGGNKGAGFGKREKIGVGGQSEEQGGR